MVSASALSGKRARPAASGCSTPRKRSLASGREPGETFEMASEVVAVEGDVGVVRVRVRYTAPRDQVFLDLWIVELGPDGRCVRFEEWPFWPPGTPGGYDPGPSP